MPIELTEEASSLLYHLREDLVRCQEQLTNDPVAAARGLTQAIKDLSDWIGPGVP